MTLAGGLAAVLPQIPATIVTVCLAALFAFAGAGLLGRRQEGLAGGTFALLVGLAGAATALFPLSLLLPRHALVAVLVLSIICAISGRIRVFPVVNVPRDAVSVGIAAVLTAATTVFAILNFRRVYDWDGFQIWATKAYLLYERGALTSYLWTPTSQEHFAAYPPLLPMYEALVMLVRGEFSWTLTKPVFLVFYVAMVISMYQAARALATPRLALYGTALLALIPGVSIHTSTGGYADMPLACFVCALLAVLLSRPNEHTGVVAAWLLAGLLMVKNEGLLLFLLASAAVLAAWLTRGLRGAADALFRHRVPVAIAGGALVLRLAEIAWHGSQTAVYRYDLPRALDRIPQLLALSTRYLADFSQWGLIWPAFALACAVLVWRGGMVQRILAITTLTGCAGYTLIFLFTQWDMKVHADSAYQRIFIPIAPAAILVIVSAASLLLQTGARNTVAEREPLKDSSAATNSDAHKTVA